MEDNVRWADNVRSESFLERIREKWKIFETIRKRKKK